MSLALVGDRKASGLKISAPVTPRGMYFPSTPLPLPPSILLLLSEKDTVLNRMYEEGQGGNGLTSSGVVMGGPTGRPPRAALFKGQQIESVVKNYVV